jgi:hypothetical protein
MHVDQVLAGVPKSQRCGCTPSEQAARGFWSLFGRR